MQSRERKSRNLYYKSERTCAGIESGREGGLARREKAPALADRGRNKSGRFISTVFQFSGYYVKEFRAFIT